MTVTPELKSNWRRQSLGNALQTILLLAIMAGFLALIGGLLMGPNGILILLLGGALTVLLNPIFSPALVMRVHQARPIKRAWAPALYQILDALGERAGLPQTPTLYEVPEQGVNAFAVGTPRHAAIGLTQDLIRILDWRELTSVLAHETSHIANRDVLVLGMADLFNRLTGALSILGQMLLILALPMILWSDVTISWAAIFLLIFAPYMSALTQLALNRAREYNADLNAVRLTGDPEAMISTLIKIEQFQGGFWERVLRPGRRGKDTSSLLRTHPTMEERVNRLRALDPETLPHPIQPRR